MARIFLVFLFFCATLAASPKKVEAFFTPDDHLADKLISLIEKEKRSVHVAIYTFSHQGIVSALCDARGRGVEVTVIIDPFSLNFPGTLKKLSAARVPVWIWRPACSEKKLPLMHDKFCILGGKEVWTGSFNFTYDADRRNAENALVLRDEEIAQKFEEHFQALKTHGCHLYKP